MARRLTDTYFVECEYFYTITQHADMEYKYLARWCNNKLIFAKCKRFEDYDRKR